MKKLVYITPLFLVLTGCTSAATPELNQLLQNPLFAEQYAEEINERFTTLQINQVEELDETAMLSKVEAEKAKWLKVSKAASQKRFDGLYGNFSVADGYEYIGGGVLIYKNILYFSPDFIVTPAPTMSIYFSAAVDPRETDFPTADDVLFGALLHPYGMQQYEVQTVPENIRTIVIYDELLRKIIGFAQM